MTRARRAVVIFLQDKEDDIGRSTTNFEQAALVKAHFFDRLMMVLFAPPSSPNVPFFAMGAFLSRKQGENCR
jgi:hypothetical protein